MKLFKKLLVGIMLIASMSFIINPHSSKAAYSPHIVESSVKNNWNGIRGWKNNDMRSGKNFVYDVYSTKYTSGGYRVVNQDFGQGYQPYINFQGWAVLFGYKRHTSTNHDTYVVATKTSGDSGVGTTKVYKTAHINLSATEELEYNNQGSGVWNECGSSAINKDNQYDCNMRYDNVGFNAYLPLKELFPNGYEKATWKLYLVKRVDSHIVYTELKLPFTFSNKTYNGGTLDLTSGLNANKLTMIGTNVMKRTYPRQNGSGSTLGYFNTGYTYTRVGADEQGTGVWYGVSTGGTRWAVTAYWSFNGSQAVINYNPPPDTDPPSHIAHSLSGARYQNGNDYWVQPNDSPWIRLRQHDGTANLYQYLRLYGSGADSRSQHDFTQGLQHNNHWYTDPNVKINAAVREENTKYGRVAWKVTPYTHGHTYNVQYYYRDTENNVVGYNNTGMRLRVDGVEPSHNSMEILNYRYRNGNNWWVRPNDQVYIGLRQYDPHSGNRYQYIRLYGSGQEVRAQHDFFNANNHNNHWWTDTSVVINSAYREENTAYGKVKWGVVPKTHGHGYNITYYYRDNADNVSPDYIDTGQNLWVDGVAPSVSFSPYSQGWTNSNIAVGVNLSDSHSGVKGYRYRIYSNGSWSAYSDWNYSAGGNITLSNSGQNRVHVQSIDNVGNVGDSYSGYYYIDKTNPNGVFTPYSKSWTNSNITVGLNFSDSYSGVKGFRYRTYSNGTWSSYSTWYYSVNGSVTLSNEGQNRIHIQSLDNAGNISNQYSGDYYIDKTNPNHNSHDITGYTYKSGNNYWVQPNQSMNVRLRAYDYHSRVDLSYIRLYGSSEASSQHNWNSNSTHLNNYQTTSGISVNSVSRTYLSSDQRYKEVTFNVTPKIHGQYYNVYSLYRDNATNWSDSHSWRSTGMTIRADGVAPTHVSNGIYGARYVNGSDYWIRPNDNVNIRVRQSDPHSGNKFQYLRVTGSGVDARSQHDFYNTSTHNNHWMTSANVIINSAQREENTSYGRVLWNVTGKTHGHTYGIETYFTDNVYNSRGYLSTGKRLRVDGVAPTVVYRNYDDTSNFTSRDWSADDLQVRLKYSDPHSGYKQSRYAWTLSPNTPSESEWSAWTTNSNYVVTKTAAGKWYLHTQMQDNVGNIRTSVNGEYFLNHPPVANFTFNKSKYYIGDTAQITDASYDEDGDVLTHKYIITAPDGRVDTKTTPDFSYYFDQVGEFTIKLELQDARGGTDTITKIVTVYELNITGTVDHTPQWKAIHQEKGNEPHQYYSGEDLILASEITDYPANYVKATLTGRLVNGNLYSRSVNLTKQSSTVYTGEFDGQDFIEKFPLRKGIVPIKFEVQYINGQIRTYTVNIEIIDNALNAYNLHRLY